MTNRAKSSETKLYRQGKRWEGQRKNSLTRFFERLNLKRMSLEILFYPREIIVVNLSLKFHEKQCQQNPKNLEFA